jgi:hypothetical protein
MASQAPEVVGVQRVERRLTAEEIGELLMAATAPDPVGFRSSSKVRAGSRARSVPRVVSAPCP